MTDEQIIGLYFQRSEQAITATADQYGMLLYRLSFRMLHDHEDADECVNDTYFAVWNKIPPTRPNHFATFLSKITRRLSIDKWRKKQATMRGAGQVAIAVEELDGTLGTTEGPEDMLLYSELTRAVHGFIGSLREQERRVFICRYWYMDPIADIAFNFGFSQAKVKTMLCRTRKKLREHLEKEGII